MSDPPSLRKTNSVMGLLYHKIFQARSIMPSMDIHSGFIAVAAILVFIALISIWSGIHDIQSARKMTFFRLRRQRMGTGWRLFGLALILVVLAVALPLYGEPVAYEYFPPSPTITVTPSITPIPTITLTPSITVTPSITLTPNESVTFTPTTTPYLPLPIVASFNSSVTPNPQAVLSPLMFSNALNYPPTNTQTVFQNPVGTLYGIYSYDKMVPGVQWTAIWYRDNVQVCLETHPFNGGSGGWDNTK